MPLLVMLQEPWSGIPARIEQLGRGTGVGLVAFAIATTVMAVGWAAATLASTVVRGSLRAARFNDGVRRVVGSGTSARHEPAAVVAWAVYWMVMAGAALLALEALGFSFGASVAGRLGEVIPAIVTSAVLFAVGSLIAMLVGFVTRRFLESADIRAARFQGQVVTGTLTGFAALLALEQLGFAAQFVMALGIVAAATAGLAIALAFGLGCRDLARDFIVEYLRSLDDEKAKRSD